MMLRHNKHGPKNRHKTGLRGKRFIFQNVAGKLVFRLEWMVKWSRQDWELEAR